MKQNGARKTKQALTLLVVISFAVSLIAISFAMHAVQEVDKQIQLFEKNMS